MKTKIIYVSSILLVIIYSSPMFAQSPFHINHSDNSSSINDYFIPHYEPTLNSEIIKIDSLISISVQGNRHKVLFQYNDNNKIKEWSVLGYSDFDPSWSIIDKHERHYDEQGNLITEFLLDWYLDEWDSTSRSDYSYEMGMLSQSVDKNYNNNSWENRTRYNYVYDQNHNLTTELVERWVDKKWQNRWLFTDYYSLKDKRDSSLFQTWVNGGWQNDRKTVYYYSENQIDLDSLVLKSWDGVSWINFLKREVVSDANHNQIEQLDKFWNNGVWLNDMRRFFSYTDANFLERANCEIWDNNRWINGNGDILISNPDGFRVGFITNNVIAYYSNIVSIDENIGISDYSLSQNYPNPFNPTTTISYSLNKASVINLELFDALGRKIKTLVNEYKSTGTYNYKLDMSDFPSGVYIYKLSNRETGISKKLVYLK